MALTKGLIAVAALSLAVVLPGSAASPPGTNETTVRLKAVTSRLDSRIASLVVEATDPVSYVTNTPDSLTLVLELRNVSSDGVSNKVRADARSPIAGVNVEPADLDGAVGSRVRIMLAEPVAHRVRSEKNKVVVEFDRPGGNAYMRPASGQSTRVRAAGGGIGGADPMTALNLQMLAEPAAPGAPSTQAAAQPAPPAPGQTAPPAPAAPQTTTAPGQRQSTPEHQ